MGIAVVTGANSGIGLATTIQLARDGHEVYGAMRDLDKADDLRQACQDADLDNVRLLRIDVTNDHVIDLAFTQVRKQSGPVDILVNNAGVSHGRAVEDTTVEEYQDVMDANFTGTVRCVKQVLPSMRERGTGCIVNISSVAGRFAQPSMGAYVASKYAVEGFSEVLAQEVAPYGIRVAIIEPGTINTPIFAKAGDPRPDTTAYPMFYERTFAYFAKTLLTAPGPELVAEAVSQAITTDDPKLRYLVGTDAEALAQGRAALTDEALVAMAAGTTDEWYDAFAAATGLDVRL
jgi:NAD(P)-dependent dehydrogenase (short-subunit alcohol dehydrogenase family)